MPVDVQSLGADWLVASSAFHSIDVVTGILFGAFEEIDEENDEDIWRFIEVVTYCFLEGCFAAPTDSSPLLWQRC